MATEARLAPPSFTVCPSPGNRSIYRAGPGGTVPHSFYLYFVDARTTGQQEIRAYFHDEEAPIESLSELWEILTEVNPGDNTNMLQNACDDLDWPPKIGYDFKAVHRRRKSFIVVVVADNDRKLETCKALTIPGAPAHENHTFFDGVDWGAFEITNSHGQTVMLSAVSFINHMNRDDSGEDLGRGERHEYRFQLHFKSRSGGLLQAERARFEDSGGTNLGPPVPPPARKKRADGENQGPGGS